MSYLSQSLILIAAVLLGCSNDDVKEPVAAFDHTSDSNYIAPSSVSFKNKSTNAREYTWDIGDGSPVSDNVNPIHVYGQAGTYTVTLIAANGDRFDQFEEDIIIYTLPTADFIYSSDNDFKAGSRVIFENKSLNSVSYSWDFGDAASSTETSPEHTYEEAGTYTVELTATNSKGNDVKTAEITIKPSTNPKLSFAQATMSVVESDGVIEAEMVLDRPYEQNLTVEYTLSGTASDQDVVGTASADYEVVGDHGVVVIPSGQTSGAIQLKLYNDLVFEANETIEISVVDLNTNDVEITTQDKIVITVHNDDTELIASFIKTTMTVSEAVAVEGLLELPVQLDKTATTDIIVEYSINIGGPDSAIDSLFGFENDLPSSSYDYYVHGTKGRLVIPSGSSTANIELQILTDFMFENDEVIELTLTGTNTVQIGTNKTMIVTIKKQNGKVIALVWDDSYTDVDMDMFLWVGQDTSSMQEVVATALTPRTTPQQELIFVPALIDAGAFGLSYVDYSGSESPMNFEVQFVDFTDGVVEDLANRDLFAASYTQANINRWDGDTGVLPPIIEHRFVISNGVFSYGKIQVPISASRMKKQIPPATLRRHPPLTSERLLSY